jgi:hypothetical protein
MEYRAGRVDTPASSDIPQPGVEVCASASLVRVRPSAQLGLGVQARTPGRCGPTRATPARRPGWCSSPPCGSPPRRAHHLRGCNSRPSAWTSRCARTGWAAPGAAARTASPVGGRTASPVPQRAWSRLGFGDAAPPPCLAVAPTGALRSSLLFLSKGTQRRARRRRGSAFVGKIL